jgi:hypothetical protein
MIMWVEPIEEAKENKAVERFLRILLEERINFSTAEEILDKTKRIMEQLNRGA